MGGFVAVSGPKNSRDCRLVRARAGHCTWRADAGRAQQGVGYAPSEARSLHVAGNAERSEV